MYCQDWWRFLFNPFNRVVAFEHPRFFCWMFVVSEVHRFEFARRNDDRGGAVKMCFQMLPPFFLGGGQDVSEYKPAVPFGH